MKKFAISSALIFVCLSGCLKSKAEHLDNKDSVVPKRDSESPKNSIKDIDAIILQGDSSIGVHAPNNWILDKTTAENFGMCAMYIVNGSTFDNSPAIIYPRLVSKNSIESAVQEQAKKYKELSPKFTVETVPKYKNKKGLTFEVRKFLNGPSPNNFEIVGYFKFKKELFLAVYSAKELNSFNKHKTAFNNFLDRVYPYDTDMSALSGNCLYPRN